MSATTLALMLLADGRFPAGGHVHSWGVESGVADGRICDESTLEDFVRGRLVTIGLVDAALAAATTQRLTAAGSPGECGAILMMLDEEANARMQTPTLRHASRRLGRQLARAAARCWPHSLLVTVADTFPEGGHQSVVLGAAAVAAGLSPTDAANLSAHQTISAPAQAAVRLLGLDPYAVAALIARLGDTANIVVATAVSAGAGALADLPSLSAPLIDITATEHSRWDVRLFAT
jgi:urease accessory protein